ncbi:TSUP family transporter [Paenarthrobacter nicotinovorans]|uniref:TSUP family transporter n=1 Tax=Paenarthrobacter nicotinovorans TaxID=29320 RepID=UPI0039A4C6AB
MTIEQIVLVCAAVWLGAATQRLTGLGFALVATPFLVLVTGPAEGVSLGNALSAVLCLTVVVTTWRSIQWRRVLTMFIPALADIRLGALVVSSVSTTTLLLGVGSISVAAVVAVILSRRRALLPGLPGALIAGALSGFMNTTAGLGGPMVAVHSASERWSPKEFVGTAQVFLLGVNSLSLAGKGLPATVPPMLCVASLAAVALGAGTGHFLSPFIPQKAGNTVVLGLALTGSCTAVLRGLLSA